MELNYMLTSLAVALGVFCGAALGYIAKEELKPGKGYLVLLQNAVLAAMVILVVYFNQKPYISVLAAFVFFLMLMHTKLAKEPNQVHNYFAYALFALLFFQSKGFVPFSAMMFLYGFPTGSFLYMKKKGIEKAALVAGFFFALTLVLAFATTCPSLA